MIINGKSISTKTELLEVIKQGVNILDSMSIVGVENFKSFLPQLF